MDGTEKKPSFVNVNIKDKDKDRAKPTHKGTNPQNKNPKLAATAATASKPKKRESIVVLEGVQKMGPLAFEGYARELETQRVKMRHILAIKYGISPVAFTERQYGLMSGIISCAMFMLWARDGQVWYQAKPQCIRFAATQRLETEFAEATAVLERDITTSLKLAKEIVEKMAQDNGEMVNEALARLEVAGGEKATNKNGDKMKTDTGTSKSKKIEKWREE